MAQPSAGRRLLAGLGLLAIPGVGPVVAAGWLVATAAGAAAGGLTGGIVGALTQAGVSDEDAQVYAEGVRRGGTLVTARVNDPTPRGSKRSSIVLPGARRSPHFLRAGRMEIFRRGRQALLGGRSAKVPRHVPVTLRLDH